jgi:hypothetical protein
VTCDCLSADTTTDVLHEEDVCSVLRVESQVNADSSSCIKSSALQDLHLQQNCDDATLSDPKSAIQINHHSIRNPPGQFPSAMVAVAQAF